MTSAFHSLPYPSLEDGNISYPKGSYEVDVKSHENALGVTLTHKLDNARFIENQIKKGRAEYGCLLSVPTTGYRELYKSSTPSQEIKWESGIVGEPPIIRPIIIAVKEFKHTFTRSDDVADIWVEKTINVPKGARLARDTFLRSQAPSMQSLLNVIPDDDLSPGSFEVRSKSDDGFMFNVHVATDLSKFLATRGLDDGLRESIGAHMVSSCFAILKLEFGNPTNGASHEEYSNLKMLASMFERDNIPLWTETHFSPSRAATSLHPLLLPTSSDDGGE